MSSSPSSLSSSELGGDLTPLHDVICDVHVVLGTGTLSVRECLELRRHSVMRLVQTAGADLQVVVNGVLVAHGEVVIVDDSTAIRITEIAAPPSSESGK
jgi:flagellar motor switch protein FliN